MGESQFISTSHSRWPISLRILFGLPPPPSTHTPTKKNVGGFGGKRNRPTQTSKSRLLRSTDGSTKPGWAFVCTHTRTHSLRCIGLVKEESAPAPLLIKVGFVAGDPTAATHTTERTATPMLHRQPLLSPVFGRVN